MNIKTAYGIINMQTARIKTLHGKRFIHKGYEYEVRYEGGFAAFVALYRRELGKRNFKFYKGEGCYDCLGAATAWDKLQKLLP